MFDTQKRSNYLVFVSLLAVILLVIFTYMYWTMDEKLMGRVGSFVQIVTVFSMLTGGIITILSFKQQLDDRERSLSVQYANITQSAINDVDKIFMSNPLLDRLYLEMYQNSPQIKEIKTLKSTPEVTPDVLKQEHHMSNIIFQKIADIYFCEQLDTCTLEDSVEWINTFRRWLKSKVLRTHWAHLKREHHPDVQRFIDDIIIGGIDPTQ